MRGRCATLSKRGKREKEYTKRKESAVGGEKKRCYANDKKIYSWEEGGPISTKKIGCGEAYTDRRRWK